MWMGQRLMIEMFIQIILISPEIELSDKSHTNEPETNQS